MRKTTLLLFFCSLIHGCAFIQLVSSPETNKLTTIGSNTIVSPNCIRLFTTDAAGVQTVKSIFLNDHCVEPREGNNVDINEESGWVRATEGNIATRYKILESPNECLRILEVVVNYGGSQSFREFILVEFARDNIFEGDSDKFLTLFGSFRDIESEETKAVIDKVRNTRTFWGNC